MTDPDADPPAPPPPALTPAADPGWESQNPTAYQWTLDAFDLLRTGRLSVTLTIKENVSQATATGECPRCHDQFRDAQVLDAITGEDIRTLGTRALPSSGYVGLTITCRCTEAHTGRPDGIVEGCGINFRVEVNAKNATRG